MVQVSAHPPPYSREDPSFPPLLQGDVNNRAWTFQRAFEEARELVRYSVLNTFKIWSADWPLKGQKIPREHAQLAYSNAPEDLRRAVDWQLRWDTAVWMTSDFGRRCHEHFRKEDMGVQQDILSPDELEKEFDAATPGVQQSVLLTIPSWMEYNHGIQWPMPCRDNIRQAYEAAPQPLKSAVCFILEIIWEPLPLRSPRAVDDVRVYFREMVMSHRMEAEGWNAEGQALDLW
ncbi:hypothetical protein PENSPDRAFT_648987 [Peniophora sp. CONT]|nr:hypothetical protein PENSPDRAFT_648987 [Peniophora sp. CONT]